MRGRRVALVLGCVALAVIWLGPLPALAATSFTAHMTMHMGIVAIAAPLLAIGVAGGRFDPVTRAPALFPPVPWSVLELLVVWAWHAPVLHHAARHSAPAFALEQGSFLLAGFIVWIAAFGGDARLRSDRTGAGMVALLLTSMHMTLLGALLALSPRPLFAHGHAHDHAHGALSPLADQHLGGAVMLLVGGIAYLAGGLWLGARLLRQARAGRRGVR